MRLKLLWNLRRVWHEVASWKQEAAAAAAVLVRRVLVFVASALTR